MNPLNSTENIVPKKPKLLIHMGYHKTATTFWQRQVFSIPCFNLIDRLQSQAHFLEKTPYNFSAKALNEWLAQVIDPNKMNVISDEELLGNIHTGGNGGSITYEVIERIAAIEGVELYILLFFREQTSMIESCYRQYVKKGGCYSIQNYIYPPKSAVRHRFAAFSLEHFMYHDAIEHLQRKMSKKNVLALPYEKFCEKPNEVYAELGKLLGSQKLEVAIRDGLKLLDGQKTSNKSLSNLSLILAKVFNRLSRHDPIARHSFIHIPYIDVIFKKLYEGIDRFIPRKYRYLSLLSSEQKSNLRELYCLSNSKLEKLLGISLAQYGYSAQSEKDSLS
ncbi:MAG: hypothetical protein COW84_07415 [Gammaproteobacteria bacterium CG22_combo_CG10-13_8_21_14_all_40_8]|nr:MAG: hypothetical protein COW84_07415 [Gammaproteobacteria bacterium CG22_combo_CG10-13_8_21_14_all_40_8]